MRKDFSQHDKTAPTLKGETAPTLKGASKMFPLGNLKGVSSRSYLFEKSFLG